MFLFSFGNEILLILLFRYDFCGFMINFYKIGQDLGRLCCFLKICGNLAQVIEIYYDWKDLNLIYFSCFTQIFIDFMPINYVS